MENEVKKDNRLIAKHIKGVMKDSGWSATEIAGHMGMTTPSQVKLVAQVMQTGDIGNLHMRTALELMRACGYRLTVACFEVEKEE